MKVTIPGKRLSHKPSDFSYPNILFFIFLSVILFLNYLLPQDILSLLVTLLICGYLLFCKDTMCLPCMIYFSLFAFLFRFGNYSIYVFIVSCYIVRFILGHRKSGLNLLIFLPVYLAFHLCSSEFGELKLGDFFPFINIFCIYAACADYRSEQRETCLYYYVIAHIVATILGFFKGFTRLSLILENDFLSAHSIVDIHRFSGLSYDANFYTITAIIALAILFLELNKGHFFLWIAAIMFCSVSGFFTFSKSFFACYIALVAVVIVFSSKKTKKQILKAAPFVLLLVLIFHSELWHVIDIFLTRFEHTHSLSALTTGRSDLWKLYMEDIFRSFGSFFFGYGITPLKTPTSSDVYAAHNTFLELLFKFGLLGTLFDFLYLFLCYRAMHCTHRFSLSGFFVAFIFLMLIFNLSAYTFYSFWACLLIIWISNTDPAPPARFSDGALDIIPK